MPRLCSVCGHSKVAVKRPKNGQLLCHECFYSAFEEEIHHTIVNAKLFNRGDKVAIGVSGGKDSTVLAHIMHKLNKKYDYGLDLCLLSIDEGISGYRDDSLETVKKNQLRYELPLKILSYKELYGWTMDEIVREIGNKSNCTFCGVFRRQALDRGAAILGVDHIVTGHNADDIAETVIMNIMRGDYARLIRTTSIKTSFGKILPRSKPLMYAYQKEIVLYAYFKNIDCFTTECTYSRDAYRGGARTLVKALEAVNPRIILDIVYSGESFYNDKVKNDNLLKHEEAALRNCERCGYMSSNTLCQACVLLDRLNRGLPSSLIRSIRIPPPKNANTHIQNT